MSKLLGVITDILYEQDPMYSGCKERGSECEYIDEAQSILDRIESGCPLVFAITYSLAEGFNQKQPRPLSIYNIRKAIQALI